MTTIERELKPLNCGQRSFYGKAKVIEDIDNGLTVYMALQSYSTIVVDIDFVGDKNIITIKDFHSKTTRRHIRDFIIQCYGLQMWSKIERESKEGATEWTL